MLAAERGSDYTEAAAALLGWQLRMREGVCKSNQLLFDLGAHKSNAATSIAASASSITEAASAPCAPAIADILKVVCGDIFLARLDLQTKSSHFITVGYPFLHKKIIFQINVANVLSWRSGEQCVT